jgi:hypothetical protein
MKPTVTVKINLEPLRKYAAIVAQDLRGSGNGPIRDAMRQWAVRYRSYLHERFDSNSKGGGWPPLAQSTQRRRRGARRGAAGPRVFSLLRDTGTLFNALTPEFSRKPGQLQEDIPFGVRVGFGGPAKHPKGKASIADVAHFHQIGAGPLPVRKIIVEPDDATVKRMVSDMDRAVARLLKETGNQ